MTTRSSTKKVLQSFHAREGLWNVFISKAKEMDCTVDYLINEAMRMFASNQGFLRSDDMPNVTDTPVRGSGSFSLPEPTFDSALRTSTQDSASGSAPVARPMAPSPPPLPSPSRMSMTVPVPTAAYPTPPPSPPARADVSSSSRAAVPTNMPRLTMIHLGSKVPVRGEQFVLGRGSKSSDYAIKDTNVSRRHAAIIFHNGTFYLKDLGSTNGVEYKGKRIDSKRIDEGDVFSICGHELHFTYLE